MVFWNNKHWEISLLSCHSRPKNSISHRNWYDGWVW